MHPGVSAAEWQRDLIDRSRAVRQCSLFAALASHRVAVMIRVLALEQLAGSLAPREALV